MALTQASPIPSPLVSPAGVERQPPSPPSPAPSTEPAPAPTTPAAPPLTAAPVTPAAASGAIGFTLTFDPGTERMILEAREAATGFVIDQIPPKYVVKQFSAQSSVNASPGRGGRLNKAS
jgi:hypothetical protein